jgi:uncharacterized protein YkwD
MTRSRRAPAAGLGMLALVLLAPSAPAAVLDYEDHLAPPAVCPGADTPAPSDDQLASAMLCMIDFARVAQGLRTLAHPSQLAVSTGIKADDIVRCGDVSHTACGRTMTESFQEAGYITPDITPEVSENLGVATGIAATARTIIRAWLEDDMHRDTLFGSQWRDGGVAVRRAPATLGLDQATVWVAHFGSGRGVAPARQQGATTGSGTGDGPSTGATPVSSTAPGTSPGDGAGGGAGGGPATGLRLSVTPSLAVSGRRTRFSFVLSSAVAGGRRAIPWRLVYFARQRALADARGRLTIVTRFKRPGRYRAIVLLGGVRATATVVVLPRT